MRLKPENIFFMEETGIWNDDLPKIRYVTQGYMGMGVPMKLKFTFLSNI
jgi:hypothetical protein